MCSRDPKFTSPASLDGWVPLDVASLHDLAVQHHALPSYDAAWGITHVTLDGVTYFAATRLGGVA